MESVGRSDLNTIDFEQQTKIIKGLQQGYYKHDLLAVGKDGRLEKVSFFGKIWRFLYLGFEDCKIEKIANAIADLAEKSAIIYPPKETLYHEKKVLMEDPRSVQFKMLCASELAGVISHLERRYKNREISSKEIVKLSNLWEQRVRIWPYSIGQAGFIDDSTPKLPDFKTHLKKSNLKDNKAVQEFLKLETTRKVDFNKKFP